MSIPPRAAAGTETRAATRPLVAADVYAAAVDGVSAISDTHLHVRVDVPGRLDAERLLAAIAALSRSVPALAARFRRGWWRAYWVPDPDPRWDLQEYHDVSSVQAEEIEACLYALPFVACGELPLRLRLLHMDGHDRLLLRVNHLLGDGGGTKNLCYLLARTYRELGTNPAWSPPPQRVPQPLLRMLRSMRLSRLPALILGALDEIIANRPMRPFLVPMDGNGSGTNRLASLHLPPSRVDRLRAKWRGQGVTLNDLALSAFSRAVVRAFPQVNATCSHASFVVTADLRQYRPPTLDVSNFSSLRPLSLGRLPLPGPREQLRRVLRATRTWKAGQTGLLLATSSIAMVSILPYAWIQRVVRFFLGLLLGRKGGFIALTNIGPIQARLLDFGHGPCLAARVASPIASPPMLIAALTGCAGALDFTLGYREPLLARSAVRRLLDALDKELAALE